MPANQAAAKLDIGFVSEDMRLYGAATLAWHMNFLLSIYPRWDESYADKFVHRFDLKPHQKIKGLSLGQRVGDPSEHPDSSPTEFNGLSPPSHSPTQIRPQVAQAPWFLNRQVDGKRATCALEASSRPRSQERHRDHTDT
jgi:hypothetical protein